MEIKKTIADYPELLVQWHPIKNGSLKPEDVSYGSTKKVWWKCSVALDHEWIAVVGNRTNGRGCPCCSNPIKKIVKSNCLATTHPEIAKQWHPTKNGNLKPENVVYGENKKIWWKCPVSSDHEWETSLNNRTANNKNGTIPGCPCCSGHKVVASNCLLVTHPEIAKQWHPIKNGNLKPENVSHGSNKKVWWKCLRNHEWKISTNKRTSGYNCPICNESKGENKVAKILNEKYIIFKRQYRFTSCRNKIPLPFDFVIWYNGKICAIEFQGQQHYLPTTFGSKKLDIVNELKNIKYRDTIKAKWSKNKNMPLLIIPYWEKNIEKVIDEFLKNTGR